MSYERDRTRFFSDRLRWEWNGIVWRHADKLGLHGMREPVFSIKREMQELGRWYPFPKWMIELKESLVLDHPWYAVCEVLRHEIAHQVTSYLNPSLDEPSHGPCFRKVCEAMGINPSAKISYKALDERVFSDDGESAEPPEMLRIRKLLALSSSPNEHEAKLAMQKAHELMLKYDLDPEAEGKEDEMVTITVGKPLAKRSEVEIMLGSILRQFFPVSTIWIQTKWYDNELKFLLEVSGTPSDVKIASYSYDFLVHAIDSAWQQLPGSGKWLPGGRKYRDFALGMLESVWRTLEKENAKGQECGLVLARRAKVDNYVSRRYPRLRRSGGKALTIDKSMHEAGTRSGLGLKIRAGIENQADGKIRYIGEGKDK